VTTPIRVYSIHLCGQLVCLNNSKKSKQNVHNSIFADFLFQMQHTSTSAFDI
jgi:hypothetical protein